MIQFLCGVVFIRCSILFWSDEKLGNIFASYLDGQNVRAIFTTATSFPENTTATS
jgi:hypothetical protein